MFRTSLFAGTLSVFTRAPTRRNTEPASDILAAAAQGNLLLAERLLAMDANEVTLRDRLGATPLHLAVANDHAEMAALLVANGADPNVQDPCGITPLHLAALSGNEKLANLLIAAGARRDAITAHGVTPYVAAAAHGYRALADRVLANAV